MRDLQSYCKILISLISKSKNVTMSLRIVDSNSRNFIRNTFLRLFRFIPRGCNPLGIATSNTIISYLKICIFLPFFITILFAESPFEGEDNTSVQNPADTVKNQNLNAVQNSFWYKNRTGNENILNIKFNPKSSKTYKIRTRSAMATTFIFDSDKIAQVILGDSLGFEALELGRNKYDLSNILVVKPKLIGIDTSLTIIGESGNIYNFYLFSTDYKNSRNPAILVFVSENRTIGKIKVENLELEKAKKLEEEKLALQNKLDNKKEILIIGEGIEKISIDTSKIQKGYSSYPKKKWYGSTSKDSAKLKPIEVFNDDKYTYFKYNKNRSDSKFPAVYRVVDGYDNPANVKIVGDYIIAETISDKWTLRIGNEYVCVRKKH
ncbi:hypothetical protein BKH41_08490 [Helicobacter sp. 12S02232-10]|nr:hypothetical protein BKH41_08490 [Helicobacter sp. 12S02232-10]